MADRRWALLLISCICLSATVAEADDKQDAEKQFRAGVSLQKVEDFDAAIAAFESSLRLFPTKAALFNLANCLRATHRYPEALASFERLTSEFGSELREPMQGQVEVQIAELKNLTGSLSVKVSEPGATLSIDGKEVGSSPLASPLRLGLGDHELAVSLDGFEPQVVAFNLGPGQALTRDIQLKPAAPPAPPPVPPRQVSIEHEAPPQPKASSPAVPDTGPPEPEQPSIATLVTGGVGLALLAGGGVAGVWALSLNASLGSECDNGHCPTERASDIDRMNSLANASTILLAVGGVAVGGAALMWSLGSNDGESSVSATHLQLGVGPAAARAALTHRF